MLEVSGITKTYYNGKGVFNLSFSLNKGEVLGLLGSNGSGKTTTFRVLLGLLEANSGQIYLDKQPINSLSKVFGYLPEERSLLKDLKVETQIWYLACLKQMDYSSFLTSLTYWLKFFKMEQYQKTKIGVLSKGNQQKVQLICALIHNPKILIFDEPFSGLDLENQRLFRELLMLLKKEEKYIILSTHSYAYLETYCDSMLCLYQGRISLKTTLAKLKQQITPCIVIKRRDLHPRLIKNLTYEMWDEGEECWIMLDEDARQVLLKRLLTYQIASFRYGSLPLRRVLEQAMHV